MIKKFILIGVIGLLLVCGCDAAKEYKQASKQPESFALPHPAELKKGKQVFKEEPVARSKRYIAMRIHLVVETSETDLEKVWESVNEFCRNIHCDIVESTINKKTPYSLPSGNLVLRVLPEHLKSLLEQINKVGNVVTQNTESEDKTSTVIDVEAKIKNLTELRNRLRAMLTTRTGSLKDVVEVERELSRAQSELDSLIANRKALANETEKVAVSIDFRPKPSIAETGALAPIVSAWHGMGRVFASSIGAVITFIVAVIPWLVLIIPGIWFLPKLFRKLFKRRSQ
jgi:uncharacterized protein YqgV (UPF0045/DUF77 family)